METEQLDLVVLTDKHHITKFDQTELNQKIQKEFTTDYEKDFIKHFYQYLNYDNTEFIINIDDIWTWLEYSAKGKIKQFLVKHFEVDVDYKILNLDIERKTSGGHNKETVMMTMKAFKKLCANSVKPYVKNVLKCYIKVEEILNSFIESIDNSNIIDLKIKRKRKPKEIIEENTNTVLDIINILENNPISKLTKPYQGKLINKIKNNFNTKEKELFVGSFYCYLNYDKNEFVIDLDNIWNWLGYSKKDKAKDLLEEHFHINKDYKILLSPDIFPVERENNLVGRPKEKIIMTINTFKKLCMKVRTDKSDEIHDYYVKLEEILHETLFEESSELRHELEISQTTSIGLRNELKYTEIELKNQVKKTNLLLNRRYYDVAQGHIIYLYQIDDDYRLGMTKRIEGREIEAYSRNSRTAEIVYAQYCFNCELTEKVIHHMLDKFRIRRNAEWFKLPNKTLGIKIISSVINILDSHMETIEEFISEMFDYLELKEENLLTADDLRGLNKKMKKRKVITKKNEESKSFQKCLETVEKNEYVETNNENCEDIENNENCKDIESDEKEDVCSENDDISDNNDDFEFLEDDNDIKRIIPKDTGDDIDFDLFIKECCDVDKDYFCPKQDIMQAFKFWSDSTVLQIKDVFKSYLNTNFASGVQFINDVKKNVYRGLKLKLLVFEPSDKNYDFEQFISERCEVDYTYRIGYCDFFHFFTEWKKSQDESFVLDNVYKIKIRAYLKQKFIFGRVHVSETSKSRGMRGVYCLGIKENNYGSKVKKRNNKCVGVFDSKTQVMVKSYPSVVVASRELKIPYSTLGTYIGSERTYNKQLFKFIQPVKT